jgi:hypothetical protein
MVNEVAEARGNGAAGANGEAGAEVFNKKLVGCEGFQVIPVARFFVFFVASLSSTRALTSPSQQQQWDEACGSELVPALASPASDQAGGSQLQPHSDVCCTVCHTDALSCPAYRHCSATTPAPTCSPCTSFITLSSGVGMPPTPPPGGLASHHTRLRLATCLVLVKAAQPCLEQRQVLARRSHGQISWQHASGLIAMYQLLALQVPSPCVAACRFGYGLGLTHVAKSDQSTGNHHFASHVLQSGEAMGAQLLLPP